MPLLGPFLLEVVAIVLELSYAGDSFCCPMTFSLLVTFNVGASGYICFVTLGLGRGLRSAPLTPYDAG